jgi:hypothetical protein
MWLIVLSLMFKLSPPVVSPRDPGSQSLDWGPVPHFWPLEALQSVWLIVLFTTSSWSFCCDKSAVVAAPCLLKKIFFFLSILSHECGRNKGRHWQSSLCQCKATCSGMLPGFPEAPLRYITHVPFTPSARIKASHT